ncbi:MAG: 23S rRNA (guanosine(2251)-2'-O)-methyltransferase RlmB [Armatimonadetes bacterium]|nr:23S rRNA (guanosine(2251)-2'-O)-methyltransferase RlmB [Armatimonadota bacterium]MDW8153765.1 23S rRNA (guanosine(2251)-2'-O)-methyltransferase RlmB [Armatimonadota bacterium]
MSAGKAAVQLEGRNPVLEALRAGKPLRKIQISRTARLSGSVARIVAEARSRGIPVQFVDPRHLDALSQTGTHQGVIAFAHVVPPMALEDLLDRACAQGQAFLVLLDSVQDPRNLGAILRTAEAAGAHGAVIPKHRSVGLTPAVAKASAGAVAYLPVAVVPNLPRAVEACKDWGISVVAAHLEGDPYDQVDLRPPIALVVGGEGTGVSRLVRERCDRLVCIPMYGRVSSLNASVAAGILLYEVVRSLRRAGALPQAPCRGENARG